MKADLRFLRPLFGALLIFLQTSALHAQNSSEIILSRIESRKGSWTSLDAAVKLSFKAAAQNQGSACEGALLYNRMDEKIFLDCRGENNHSVFVFKTDDRNFELYLPSHKKIYRGNIFALEDSPMIESHLRPLDLYRALKPAALSLPNVLIPQQIPGGFSIQTKAGPGRRKIEVTNEGDVVREAYEGENNTVSLVIKRAGFQAFQNGPSQNFFPKQILIKSAKDSNVWETLVEFKIVSFPPDIDKNLFAINVPEEVTVEEVN